MGARHSKGQGSGEREPEMRRPPAGAGPIAWIKSNLFSSPLNAALTVLGLWITWVFAHTAFDWAIVRAIWVGSDGGACTKAGAGACWPFIFAKLDQFIYGRYPDAERWRANLTMMLFVAGLAGVMIPGVARKGWIAVFLLIVFPVIAYYLLTGGIFGLAIVPTEKWGGLLVTLVVAVVGIVASFPIAVALALGRRSRLPFVRYASIGFIEFIRGVPLITMLFMASVMLPLFLPDGVTFDKLLRALIGVALFQGAYLAEVIRGGLQAIPQGQFEAADALALSYPQKMGLIVLPQALRLVIPGIVNSFIALLKDTSLVLIIGLFDLLGIVQQAISSDANWFSPSTPLTGYVFAGFVFWVICFGMSRYALWMERRFGGTERR